MTDEQLELLLKARQSLSAARLLLENGYPDYAASRAYYSMFYIAEAFLAGEGMSFSSHAAVISAFGREFARTDRVPAEFHRFLIDAHLAPLSVSRKPNPPAPFPTREGGAGTLTPLSC